MTGPQVTQIVLVGVLVFLALYEAFALFWLDPKYPGSTVSAVVGSWLHYWPPFLVLLTLLLWHFWESGKPR